jgi:hypothetical protein
MTEPRPHIALNRRVVEAFLLLQHYLGGHVLKRFRQVLGVALSLSVLAACSESTSVPTSAHPAAGSSAANANGRPARSVPVTSVLVDDPAFQIKSDGLGSYQNSTSLISLIQSSTTGDWDWILIPTIRRE